MRNPLSHRAQRGSITASAMIVDPADHNLIQQFARAQQRWQIDAWNYYFKLSEIQYPTDYIGTNVGRFRYLIGAVPLTDPMSPAMPIQTADRNDVTKACEEALRQLEGPTGDVSALGSLYARDMVVAGEGWLTGLDRNAMTEWEFLSTKEIQPNDSGDTSGFMRNWLGLVDGYQPFNPQFVRRFWMPNPAITGLAISGLRSLGEDCQRLIALNDSMTARIVSRLVQAGIVYFANELQIGGESDVPVDSPVGNQFVKQFLAKLESNMLSQNPAHGAVPFAITGPRGKVDEMIQFITLDRTIDRVEMELRAELRENITHGMDLPPEKQTGTGAAPFRNIWQVDDATYSSHLKPKADAWANALNAMYLWPMAQVILDAQRKTYDINELHRHRVLADGSEVVSHPNAAEDTRQLYDRLTISDNYLRSSVAVPNDAAPSDEEYVRGVGKKANVPYLATWGLPVHDEIDWSLVPGAATAGQPGAGGEPTSRRPADSSDPTGTPGKPGSGTVGKPKAEQTADIFAEIAEAALADLEPGDRIDLANLVDALYQETGSGRSDMFADRVMAFIGAAPGIDALRALALDVLSASDS